MHDDLDDPLVGKFFSDDSLFSTHFDYREPRLVHVLNDLRIPAKQELLNAMIGCGQDDFSKQGVFLPQCHGGDRTVDQRFLEIFETPDFFSKICSQFPHAMRNQVFDQRCAILKHSVQGFAGDIRGFGDILHRSSVNPVLPETGDCGFPDNLSRLGVVPPTDAYCVFSSRHEAS
ncbi:MAG: hypothetical protein OXC69_05695 [Candidatus Tectomicrobia bacterium]|nr:hypothetical protein [Candidatus Tectomicrobia bacterium]